MPRGRVATPWEEMWVPEPNSGCHLFLGHQDALGYGRVKRGSRVPVGAHRYAWRLSRGPIPKGLCVLHRCDVRSCVNPDHLFLGTQIENIDDRNRKGRTHRGPRKKARQ